ncbi:MULTISPECIES: helix-turn-helix domain-containing protein [unclassified Pseudonocardia]|nr:helix-turn-helix domain-containing protein [Pseudonocardia sp. Ae331_Ps2]
MSVAVMDAVFRSDVAGSSRRAVLLAIADHANERGLCFPAVMSVARKTGLSRATVFRSLNDLEREGVLRRARRRRRNGAWTSNGYWIQVEVLQARNRARLRARVELDTLEVLFGIAPAADTDAEPDTGSVLDTGAGIVDGAVGAAVGAGADPAGLRGLSEAPGAGLGGHTAGLPEPVFPQLTPPSHGETPPVSRCDPTGVSPRVAWNRQMTITGEATRASAPATGVDPDRSGTARPDPERDTPINAPQESATRTPRPEEAGPAAADPLEQPALAETSAVLDALRPEPAAAPAPQAAPPATDQADQGPPVAAAPIVPDLVTTAAAQAHTPPAPAELVPDPERRGTWLCPRHLAHPDPHDRPCGGCGTVRKRMQAQEAQQAATAAQRRSEAAQQARQRIAGCAECDEYGQVVDPATGDYPPLALKCDHVTPAADRIARQARHLAAQAATDAQARQISPATRALIESTRARLIARTSTNAPTGRRRLNPKTWR